MKTINNSMTNDFSGYDKNKKTCRFCLCSKCFNPDCLVKCSANIPCDFSEGLYLLMAFHGSWLLYLSNKTVYRGLCGYTNLLVPTDLFEKSWKALYIDLNLGSDVEGRIKFLYVVETLEADRKRRIEREGVKK